MLTMPPRHGAPLAAVVMLGCALLLPGCSGVKIPGVYRLDIQQGNVVTKEMLAQLEPGMDRRKVRFILGTPLIADTFNDDRWDYVYSFEPGNGDRVQRHVSIFFDNDRLARIEGDVNTGLVPEKDNTRTEAIVTVPEERPKEGLLSNLVPDFLKDRPVLRAKKKKPPKTDRSETDAAQSGALPPGVGGDPVAP